MKVSLFFLFLLFFSGMQPLQAQEFVKIGIVDIQRAIVESRAGKEAKNSFQAEVAKVETQLMKERKEVERLKSDLDKKGMLLKPEERRDMEKEFQKRYRDYQLTMRDSQEELRLKENEMTAKILKELHEVIGEIGKEEKFTLIVERSQVPFSDENIDITDKVIKAYNARNSGKAEQNK